MIIPRNNVSFTNSYLSTLEFENLVRPQECDLVQVDNIQDDEEFTN